MSVPVISVRRRLAAVEPFGEDDAFLLVIADRFVERLHLLLSGAPSVAVFRCRLAQPVFGRVHDRAAISLVAMVGIDGDVIDPAAMAVVADQPMATMARRRARQHRRVRSLRASAMSAAGSFHGRVKPQRCHSAITAATSPSSIGAMASAALGMVGGAFTAPCRGS